jgi:hypothetical protein
VPGQTRDNGLRFRIGAFVVPPSLRLSKGGLRCEPDVVDQMELPTALAFAVAAQIHVSHSPVIIRLRDRQLLRCCCQRPMLIEKFRRIDEARSTGKDNRYSIVITVCWQYADGIIGAVISVYLRQRARRVCRLVNLRHDPTSNLRHVLLGFTPLQDHDERNPDIG